MIAIYFIGIVNYDESCVAFESLIRHDVLYECYGPHFGDVIETHAEMGLETLSFQVHLLFQRDQLTLTITGQLLMSD
jgi:hypothetical protein